MGESGEGWELLACPVCRGDLVRTSDLACRACGRHFPIAGGIPVLLPPDTEARDLWEEAESGLARLLSANPQLAREMFERDAGDLAPADAWARALVLDERGDPTEIHAAFAQLYEPEWIEAVESAADLLVEELSGTGVVVDLASGRGMLLERLQRHLGAAAVATDISPRVLRRAVRRGWRAVACDVAALPFRDATVATMTTLLGLNHIRDGAGTLRELRRVAQRLLAVHQVFEPGTANDQAIVELGFADLAYATTYRDTLMAAGWRPEVRFERRVTARPTPRGVLLDGLQIDALPVEPVDVSILLIDAH